MCIDWVRSSDFHRCLRGNFRAIYFISPPTSKSISGAHRSWKSGIGLFKCNICCCSARIIVNCCPVVIVFNRAALCTCGDGIFFCRPFCSKGAICGCPIVCTARAKFDATIVPAIKDVTRASSRCWKRYAWSHPFRIKRYGCIICCGKIWNACVVIIYLIASSAFCPTSECIDLYHMGVFGFVIIIHESDCELSFKSIICKLLSFIILQCLGAHAYIMIGVAIAVECDCIGDWRPNRCEGDMAPSAGSNCKFGEILVYCCRAIVACNIQTCEEISRACWRGDWDILRLGWCVIWRRADTAVFVINFDWIIDWTCVCGDGDILNIFCIGNVQGDCCLCVGICECDCRVWRCPAIEVIPCNWCCGDWDTTFTVYHHIRFKGVDCNTFNACGFCSGDFCCIKVWACVADITVRAVFIRAWFCLNSERVNACSVCANYVIVFICKIKWSFAEPCFCWNRCSVFQKHNIICDCDACNGGCCRPCCNAKASPLQTGWCAKLCGGDAAIKLEGVAVSEFEVLVVDQGQGKGCRHGAFANICRIIGCALKFNGWRRCALWTMHNIVCACNRVCNGVAVVWFGYSNSAFFKPNLGLNNRHGDSCGLCHKVLAFSSRHGDGDNLILRGDFFACNSDCVVFARFNRHICGIAAWYADFAAAWGDWLIIKFVCKVGWSGVAVNQFYVVWSDYQYWGGLMDFTIDDAGVDTVCEFKVFGVCKGECCGDVWSARVCICICAGCRNGCRGAGWRNREVRVFNKWLVNVKIGCAIICFFNICFVGCSAGCIIAVCRNGDLRLGDCGGYIRHFKCVVTGICAAECITRKGDCVCAGIGACKCCGYTRSVECAIIVSNHTGDCAVVRNGYYIVFCVIHFIVNCWFIVFIPTNLQSRDACSGNRGKLAAKVVCAGNYNADCATNHNGFVKKICAGDIQCAACDRRKVFKLIWTTCIVKLPFVCIGCLRNSVCNWCGKPAAIHCITGDGCRAGDGHGFNHDCHVCITCFAIFIRRCTNGDCVRPSSAWRATNGISSVDNLKAVVCIICVRVYCCVAKLSGNDWICECAFGFIIICGNIECVCIVGVVCGFFQRLVNKVYGFFGPFCIKGVIACCWNRCIFRNLIC